MKTIYLTWLFSVGAFLVTSQSEPVLGVFVDTSTLKTRCDCLTAEYSLKSQIMDNLVIGPDMKIVQDDATLNKRQTLLIEMRSVDKKCAEWKETSSEMEPCADLEEEYNLLNQEFELVRRVMEMNGINTCGPIITSH